MRGSFQRERRLCLRSTLAPPVFYGFMNWKCVYWAGYLPPCALIPNPLLMNTEAGNEWGFLLLCSTVVSDICRTAEPLHSSSFQVMEEKKASLCCWICGSYIHARCVEVFCWVLSITELVQSTKQCLFWISVQVKVYLLRTRSMKEYSKCHTVLHMSFLRYQTWFIEFLDCSFVL